MNAGDTFYLRGPENPRPHLWVVLSDPAQDLDNVVIANFTKVASYKDLTFCTQGGEHECLPQPSCVNYPKARIFSSAQLEEAKRKGALDSKTPLDPALLRQIQRSAADSEDIPNKHRQILIDQGLCDG